MTTTAVATHLIEVEFKGNRRAFYLWSGEEPPKVRAAVIVQVERGEDLGRVHSIGELADKRLAGTTHGKSSPQVLPAAVRLATAYEVETATLLRVDEEAVRKAALELVREMKLDMKVSDTEWQWDRRRLTCYFTAEERVDFRQLVRQLERRFSTRVHMWHIGVRDEARRLDGVGRCGRQFCSSSWLPELRPVKSSSAKDQRLSTLNPAQISGTCGRLMCCLRYEHEFYVQSRKRFPKEGRIVATSLGEEKIVSNDIFRDLVTLRTAAGEARTIPLAQYRKELGESAQPIEEPPSGGGKRELQTLRHDPREKSEPRQKRDPRVRREPRPPRVITASPDAGAEQAEPTAEQRPTAASATPPKATPEVAPEAPAEPTPAPRTASGESAEQDGSRPRGRRRRGRRGGRRGRGGEGKDEQGGEGPAGGAPPAPGSPGASDAD